MLLACARVYVKGHLNLSFDISCSLWLRCSHRVQHRLTHLSTHDCLWIFPVLKHLTTRVVCGCGPRFTPCKTHANFGASPLVLLPVDTRVGPVLNSGCPLFWPRGRGLTCVNYSCTHLCSQKSKFRPYLCKINIIYSLVKRLFYLVFYPGAGLRCKLVQKRLDFWVKVW